jgi:hypothetical protein
MNGADEETAAISICEPFWHEMAHELGIIPQRPQTVGFDQSKCRHDFSQRAARGGVNASQNYSSAGGTHRRGQAKILSFIKCWNGHGNKQNEGKPGGIRQCGRTPQPRRLADQRW